MVKEILNDEGARTIRQHWFMYLDTIEPLRETLHSYCMRLTTNVWDAEDLVQDTLLKGFGMTARGDFHGEDSPVQNIRAYLVRTATNLWLDLLRKRKFEMVMDEVPEASATPSDPVVTHDAVKKVTSLASPQEFAAILLKDVYDFSLEDIAEFVGTTTGTVKSALSRARQKMKTEPPPMPIDAATKSMVSAYAEAINSGNREKVMTLMSENVKIDVCNVGGGRGRQGSWSEKSFQNVIARYHEFDGEAIILMLKSDAPNILHDVLRLEGVGGQVQRIVDYCYAKQSLAVIAASLGMQPTERGYHQPSETITKMVATTALPWK